MEEIKRNIAEDIIQKEIKENRKCLSIVPFLQWYVKNWNSKPEL